MLALSVTLHPIVYDCPTCWLTGNLSVIVIYSPHSQAEGLVGHVISYIL